MAGNAGLSAEVAIRAGTYEGFGDEAVALAARIRSDVSLYDEPVTFGERAVDVGSRDGRHQSLIKALGPTEVTALDPDGHDLRRGLAHGILTANEVFVGTLQSWVAAGNRPADSLFVLNMLPRLANDPEFLRALSAAVAIGGVATVSFLETESNSAFWRAVDGNPELGLRALEIPTQRRIAAGLPQPGAIRKRNRYLSIWRREDV